MTLEQAAGICYPSTENLFNKIDSVSGKDFRKQTDKWIADHPKAWASFLRFGMELANKGKRFGIRLIVERIRWEEHFEYDKREFKISHNLTPYLARRLIEHIPALDGLIETRKVKF